jgi:hypothetical protein
MSTCAVSGVIKDSAESGLLSVDVCARPAGALSLSATTIIVPKEQEVTTNSSGEFTLTLSQGWTYLCVINYPPNTEDSAKRLYVTLSVPVATTANFNSIVMVE